MRLAIVFEVIIFLSLYPHPAQSHSDPGWLGKVSLADHCSGDRTVWMMPSTNPSKKKKWLRSWAGMGWMELERLWWFALISPLFLFSLRGDLGLQLNLSILGLQIPSQNVSGSPRGKQKSKGQPLPPIKIDLKTTWRCPFLFSTFSWVVFNPNPTCGVATAGRLQFHSSKSLWTEIRACGKGGFLEIVVISMVIYTRGKN